MQIIPHIFVKRNSGKAFISQSIEPFYKPSFNVLKVFGKTCNPDPLVAFYGMGQDLNEYGDPGTVDISIAIEIKNNFPGVLPNSLLVGISNHFRW